MKSLVSLIQKPQVYLPICLAYLIIMRLPGLFDELWYLDENIYLSIGYGLTKGQRLYQDVWDNKPPLIYLVYALGSMVSSSNIWVFRLINLLLGIGMVLGLSKITTRVLQFSKLATMVSSFMLTFFLVHGWEVYIFNGENLFAPLILFGMLALYSSKEITINKKTVFAYILFALAAFTKIHAIVEIGVLVLVWFITSSLNLFQKPHFKTCAMIGAIIALPYTVLVGLYGYFGQLSILFYSLVGFSQSYLSYSHPIVFGFSQEWISGNAFRSLVFILVFGLSVFLYRMKQISSQSLIIFSWVFVTTYTAFLSERPYPHYVIPLFAPLSLLAGYAIHQYVNKDLRFREKILYSIVTIFLINQVFYVFGQSAPLGIYQKPQDRLSEFTEVATGNMTLEEYQLRSNSDQLKKVKTISSLIYNHSQSNDMIYVVANTPEIYPVTGRSSAGRQITDFQYDQSIETTYREVMKKSPTLFVLDQKSPVYKDFKVLVAKNFRLIEISDGRYEAWKRI
jgi:4-amino-4-deoxy-L-arabinose transferase-like glycosyltransferase